MPRGPVREALLLLESEGLVERRLHRGAVVRAIAPETLEEVFTLRLALERVGAEFAARRRTDEDVATLRRHLEGLRTDADAAAGRRARTSRSTTRSSASPATSACRSRGAACTRSCAC